MVSRLHIMCLGLGILSTVIGCTVTPPALPPPEVPPPAAAPTGMSTLSGNTRTKRKSLTAP